MTRKNGCVQLENERATRFSFRCPVFSPLWPILQIIMSRAVSVVHYVQSFANGTQNRERSNQSMDVFKPLKCSPSFRIIPVFGIVYLWAATIWGSFFGNALGCCECTFNANIALLIQFEMREKLIGRGEKTVKKAVIVIFSGRFKRSGYAR